MRSNIDLDDAAILAMRTADSGACAISHSMLPYEMHGRRGPLIVALHWLGGSSLTWTEVGGGLAEHGARCAALDLPGFGDAESVGEFTVAASVEEVIATVQELRRDDADAPWFLMGHSMGGKFAAVIARAAVQGDDRLRGLAGVILVSPSPAGPEPMEEKQRAHLMEQLGESSRDADEDTSRAQGFVEDNVGKLPLLEGVRDLAVRDVLRMDRAAFRAWLTVGSKEDWSERVGVLPLPALVMAGSEEPALGPEAQRTHTLPHFSDARLVSLTGGGHLGPPERPAEIVGRVVNFLEELGLVLELEGAELGDGFRSVIASDATSPQTREVMEARLERRAMDASEYVLDLEERLTLRALVDRVVPGCGFDLAAQIHEELARGMENGWRHDVLPANLDAWKRGLLSLDVAAVREFGVPFVALDGARQDELLSKAREGQLGKGLLGTLHVGEAADAYDAAAMQAWFEDVRGELVKSYIADPRTMERIGFTGFADEHGFTHITLGSGETL
jgi:pimeloyl-ACP methyl ester carboxylesterase